MIATGRFFLVILFVSIFAGINGCSISRGLIATAGPDYETVAVDLPQQWYAPMIAHNGEAVQLHEWWSQFDDPILLLLLDAAQKENASIAQAAARIERARADAIAAGALGFPSLGLNAGFTRSAVSLGGPVIIQNQSQIGLQSSWEIDLFGGLARQREAAAAQLSATNFAWHDARVAIAVETANAYINYRYCEIQTNIALSDTTSRNESFRLTEIAGNAGFQAPADVALAQASAAEGSSNLALRRAQCDIATKGLVALTGLEEITLRQQLTNAPKRNAAIPQPRAFDVRAVPAEVIAQRPDIAAAERDVAVASADIGIQQAERFPRLSLSGNIAPARVSVNGGPAATIKTWSIGPSLTLPLFDAGRRTANVNAARAQYIAAEAIYRSKVRVAVKEVEEALVRVNNASERLPNLQIAAEGYRKSSEAAEVKYRYGLGSLLDREQSRRLALNAELAVYAVEQEKVSAWVALYRAVGGGWKN